MSIATLPSYSMVTLPLPPVPSYSTEPLADEETVAYTPRMGLGGPSTSAHGTYRKDWPQAILILKDQEAGRRLPTYGRGGKVIGELGLCNADKVVRVTLKLSGHISLSVSDSGSMGINLLSETRTLFAQSEGAEDRCPSILPFHLQFPYTYEHEGKKWKLPPSYESTFLGVPALFVRCMYTLTITITRIRAYWTANKTYITLLDYRPRSRPERPVVLYDSVFHSIKPVPDEWTQVEAMMDVRKDSGMRPIECHLFLPSSQTFAITDTIPIHLQLCSTVRSLLELLPPTSSLLYPSAPDRNTKVSEVRPGSSAIRLSIARQIVVEVQGQRRFRTFTLGVGKLWPVPMAIGGEDDRWSSESSTSSESASGGSSGCSRSSGGTDDEIVWLDWRGEVKCWGEVNSGGFATSRLVVKDFVVLALTPPNPRTSWLVPLQVTHPIRLVTDGWTDAGCSHPADGMYN